MMMTWQDKQATAGPWWCGTIIATGRYRLKKDGEGRLHLQHLVTDTSGMKKRWIYIKTAEFGSSDDR